MMPIAVAGAGFLAQVLWFSTQYGQQSDKLEQLDHRMVMKTTITNDELVSGRTAEGAR
jgi:hypothetical protein